MRKFLKPILQALGGTVAFLAALLLLAFLAEGAMRVTYRFTSRRFIHPYLGETYKPDHSRVSRTPEGEPFEYRLDNYGFRGPDIPAEKPAGAVTVFTLGGSTTACNEYPDETTWSGVLQRELRQGLGHTNVTVFNAGMAGATSYHFLLIFLNFLTRLQPDLVIVYEGVNDKDYVRPSSARYFRDIGYREEFVQRRSYLLLELAKRTHNRLIIALLNLVQPPWRKSADYAYHEKNYRDIAYLARGYRIPLLFMTQPVHAQLEDMQGVNGSTIRLGRDLGVPVFDLAPKFPDDAEHFLPDTVHYTPRGNEWIGREVAKFVMEQGLIPRK